MYYRVVPNEDRTGIERIDVPKYGTTLHSIREHDSSQVNSNSTETVRQWRTFYGDVDSTYSERAAERPVYISIER